MQIVVPQCVMLGDTVCRFTQVREQHRQLEENIRDCQKGIAEVQRKSAVRHDNADQVCTRCPVACFPCFFLHECVRGIEREK